MCSIGSVLVLPSQAGATRHGPLGGEMNALFEAFNIDARGATVLAQAEARRLRHNFIGTEHILLGIVRADGAGANVLASFGLTLKSLRKQVEERVGFGQLETNDHIPFTPRAKLTVEKAYTEAKRLGHDSLGSAHLLLGILLSGEGTATSVLTIDCELNIDDIRQQILAAFEPPQAAVLVTHQTTLTLTLNRPVSATEADEITAIISEYLSRQPAANSTS